MSDMSLRLNRCPNRGTAFAIHLVLSLVVFSSLVLMMLVYWFPGDLFLMDGGWEGLKLVAMVDLVLGPALTLILFKPGKPGLKMDLSLIAGLQIAALGYGFYATYNQRVVAVVFAETEFSTVSAKDNREADESLAKLNISSNPVPASQPFRVPLLMTPAAENFGQYVADILNGYPGAHHRSDQYVTLSGENAQLQKHRKTAQYLRDSEALDDVEDALGRLDRKLDDIEVYRFRARYAKGFALYDPEQSRIVDIVPVKSRSKDSDKLAQQQE